MGAMIQLEGMEEEEEGVEGEGAGWRDPGNLKLREKGGSVSADQNKPAEGSRLDFCTQRSADGDGLKAERERGRREKAKGKREKGVFMIISLCLV